jgi:hypothetical protein
MMFKKTLIAAALAVAATGSFAQYYAQGAVGQGNTGNVDCANTTKCEKSSTGNKFLVGYELGNGWAVEGLMINYGKTARSNATQNDALKTTGLGIGAAYSSKFNDDWNGRIGLSLNKNKADYSGNIAAASNTTSTQANLGLGLGYKLSNAISIIAEYDTSTSKIVNKTGSVSLMSIGLRASF